MIEQEDATRLVQHALEYRPGIEVEVFSGQRDNDRMSAANFYQLLHSGGEDEKNFFTRFGQELKVIRKYITDEDQAYIAAISALYLNKYSIVEGRDYPAFFTESSMRTLISEVDPYITALRQEPAQGGLHLQNIALAEHLSNRVKGWLHEMSSLVAKTIQEREQKKQGLSSDYADTNIGRCLDLLWDTVTYAEIMTNGGKIDSFEELLHKDENPDEMDWPNMAEAMTSVINFPTRCPDLPTVHAVNYDMLRLFQRYAQKNASYAGIVMDLKTKFYTELEEGNQDYGTSNNRLDVLRAFNAIGAQKAEGMDPSQSSVCFLGVGKGERFELPLLEMLAQNRITFKNVVGVDIQKIDIPEGFHTVYGETDIADLGSKEELRGKFDTVYIGASALWDILEKDKLEQALDSIATILSPGGRVIYDGAAPIGPSSYEQIVGDYCEAHPTEPIGLMFKQFETAKGLVGSLFNIMLPEEFIHLMSRRGLQIKYFPVDPALRTQYYEQAKKGEAPRGVENSSHPEDPNQVLYVTPDGLNTRMTYTFVKDELSPSAGPEPDLISLVMAHAQRKDAA